MQETDRDRLDPLLSQAGGDPGDLSRIDLPQHAAVGADPFVYRQAQRAGYQRLRRVGEQLVGRHPHIAPQFQHIAKPGGTEQGGTGALALDHGIGDEGRRVRQPRGIHRITGRLALEPGEAGQHRD